MVLCPSAIELLTKLLNRHNFRKLAHRSITCGISASAVENEDDGKKILKEWEERGVAVTFIY